jgi:hypothetical protein
MGYNETIMSVESFKEMNCRIGFLRPGKAAAAKKDDVYRKYHLTEFHGSRGLNYFAKSNKFKIFIPFDPSSAIKTWSL